MRSQARSWRRERHTDPPGENAEAATVPRRPRSMAEPLWVIGAIRSTPAVAFTPLARSSAGAAHLNDGSQPEDDGIR